LPTPRRLADFQVQDANGYPLQLLALKLGTAPAVLTAAVASSAAIALPAVGASNMILVSTQGPMSIRFGLVGVADAAVDGTSSMLPAAGIYLLDPGLTATHFKHIRAGAADAIFQIMAIPTQA
jgi:hypothetical protein